MLASKSIPAHAVARLWSKDWVLCAVLALLGLLLRLSLIFLWQTYKHDVSYTPGWYGAETGAIARSIAEGHGFSSPFGGSTGPTAWIGPVYPYLCAAVFKVFGIFSDSSAKVILAINSLVSAATCFVMFALGKRMFSRNIALLATATCALVPFFMRWPTTWFWDVSISAFCLTLICLLALRVVENASSGRWCWLGAAGGFSMLVNPALMTVFAVAAGWAFVRVHRRAEHRLKSAACAALMALVVISPWLVRNAVVFGQPVFLRSNFGFEFHLGNYHYSNGMGWAGRHPLMNPAERDAYARAGELAYVREHGRQAREFVRQYPGEFVNLMLHRIVWFWDGTYILYSGGEPWKPWMYWILSAPALLGMLFALTRKRPGAGLIALVLLVYPVPYYLTYTQHRYRHPIEPLLLILTAGLFASVGETLIGSVARKAPAAAVGGEAERDLCCREAQ